MKSKQNVKTKILVNLPEDHKKKYKDQDISGKQIKKSDVTIDLTQNHVRDEAGQKEKDQKYEYCVKMDSHEEKNNFKLNQDVKISVSDTHSNQQQVKLIEQLVDQTFDRCESNSIEPTRRDRGDRRIVKLLPPGYVLSSECFRLLQACRLRHQETRAAEIEQFAKKLEFSFILRIKKLQRLQTSRSSEVISRLGELIYQMAVIALANKKKLANLAKAE